MVAITETPSKAYQTTVARSLDELAEWGEAYQDLLDTQGAYGIFYTHGWLRAMWPVYSQRPSSLHFVGVWQGGSLLAMAPFQVLHKGPIQAWRRVLSFLGTHIFYLANPWPDVLVRDRTQRQPCIDAVAAYLSASAGHTWDTLDLNHGIQSSANTDLLMHALPEANFTEHLSSSAQIMLIDGYESYHASLSRNSRSQIKRQRRRLEDERKAVFHSSTTISKARWQAIRDMHSERQARLCKKGQAERYSLFNNDAESGALLNAMNWAESRGVARHYWLDIDDKPAAFCLGVQTKETYIYYFVGMGPAAEAYSGGSLLLAELIGKEARSGTKLIDLLQGINRTKLRFANQQRSLYQCSYESPHLNSQWRNAWVGTARRLARRPDSARAGQERQTLDD